MKWKIDERSQMKREINGNIPDDEMKEKWNEDRWKSIEMEDRWKDHGWKAWKWSVTRLTLQSAAKPELAKVGSSFWQAEF